MADIRQNIKKSIQDLQALANNQWISVREYPLSKIFQDNHINKSYFGPITTILKQSGLIMTEGEKGGMRYKMVNVIIDPDSITGKIIELHKINMETYNSSRPKKSRKRETIMEDQKLTKIKSEPLQLGTKVYFVNNQRICEGIIWSSKIINLEPRKFEYTVKTSDGQYNSGFKLFLSVEELINYLTTHILYFESK